MDLCFINAIVLGSKEVDSITVTGSSTFSELGTNFSSGVEDKGGASLNSSSVIKKKIQMINS